MEQIDQQLERLRQEVETARTERMLMRRVHKKACHSKQDYLVRRVQEAVKCLDTVLRIEEFYENNVDSDDNDDDSEQQPQQQRSQQVLDYESEILSKLVAVYAQQRYITLARSQNGQLARYMTSKKFDLEDEMEDIQNEFIQPIETAENDVDSLKEKYSRQVKVQRSVLTDLCERLGISEESLKVHEVTPTSPKTQRTRTSWLRFSLTRRYDDDDVKTVGTQDTCPTDSAGSSPITTTATTTILNWRRFSVQLPKRTPKQSLMYDDSSDNEEEEARRRRSMDDDWAIPDMPWGTCITEESEDLALPPQLKATQSAPVYNKNDVSFAPVTSMIATQSAPISTIIANQQRNKNFRSTGVSKKTLEVMDDYDLTFAPIEQLVAAREQKSAAALHA